jgi:hypothetical protein
MKNVIKNQKYFYLGTAIIALILSNLIFSTFDAGAEGNPWTTANGVTYLSGTGNVGIGTKTPDGTLSVLKSGSSAIYSMTTFRDSRAGNIYSFRQARGTSSNPRKSAAGDQITTLTFFGYDGSSFAKAAQLVSTVYGTPSAGNVGGNIEFRTSEGGFKNPNTAMIVEGTGDVGIGTMNPTEKLEVAGTVKADNFVKSDGSPIGGDDTWSKSGEDIYVSLSNVGIGTTTPTEKLEVEGNIKLSGNITSDSDICIGKCD